MRHFFFCAVWAAIHILTHHYFQKNDEVILELRVDSRALVAISHTETQYQKEIKKENTVCPTNLALGHQHKKNCKLVP